MRLVLATTNHGKTVEIREALKGFSIQVQDLSDYPAIKPTEEDQDSFEGNALAKARGVAKATGLAVLADDSGLVVPALDGRPGIFSARYAGSHATYEDNWRKLLTEMDGVPAAKRQAAFVCVIVLVIPGEGEWTFEGRCDGLITHAPRGAGGFGYDPVFLIPSLGKTMAELDLAVKNSLSHRGRALAGLRSWLAGKRSFKSLRVSREP